MIIDNFRVLPNVVIEWLTFCFVFGRSRDQISARRSAILSLFVALL